MNFLIFMDFLECLLEFFRIYLIFILIKIIKNRFYVHTDVAGDMMNTLACCHVAMCICVM